MADEDPLFNLDVVRDFMIANDGKVKNHQLVTHFKSFLNDPRRKVVNREKFKTFVNTLSAIKLDQTGDKVLVLRKKYRDSPVVTAPAEPAHKPKHPTPKRQKLLDRFPIRDPSPEDDTPTKPQDEPSVAMDISEPASEEVVAAAPDAAPMATDTNVPMAATEHDVPMGTKIVEPDVPVGATAVDPDVPVGATAVKPDVPVGATAVDPDVPVGATAVEPDVPVGATAVEPDIEMRAAEPKEQASESRSESVEKSGELKESSPVFEEPPEVATQSREASMTRDLESEPLNQSTVSVKEFTNKFNRVASQSEMGMVKAKPRQHGNDNRMDDSGPTSVTLDATQREWMVVSSGNDYQKIHKLLTKNPDLARKTDFITGMTALHWAAKHGNLDVVKLLCGDKSIDVNVRSNGGYTPLHLAAMQNREEVIEILIQAYNADPNIRDHSGRKAKQYLKNSASTRAQQLLASRRSASNAGAGQMGFRRVGSYSSKIRSAGHFGIHASVAVRNSWMVGGAGAAGPGGVGSDRSTSPSPASSPSIARRASAPVTQDRILMPPPQGVPIRKRRSRSHKDKENHSDGETVRSRSSSPKTISSSSDPNLAYSHPASVYLSAV